MTGIYIYNIFVTLLRRRRHVRVPAVHSMRMKFSHYVRIADACSLAHAMECGQHARRLSGGNVFSRPETGKQNNSVSGPGSGI